MSLVTTNFFTKSHSVSPTAVSISTPTLLTDRQTHTDQQQLPFHKHFPKSITFILYSNFKVHKTMDSDREVKLVKRAAILPCMSCNICNNLMQEATTLNQCMHSFCKKCIYNKLENEGMKVCPNCSGPARLSKLRPDRSLQNLIAIAFPDKKRMKKSVEAKAAEVVSTADATEYPNRKGKYRSLSSIIIRPSQGEVKGKEKEPVTTKRHSGKEKTNKQHVEDEAIGSKPLREGSQEPSAEVDASILKNDRINRPICFSLEAFHKEEKDTPLPQISPKYIEIKNAHMPVSHIQEYLKAKLNLENENEVVIRCLGAKVDPMLPLNELHECWRETLQESKTVSVSVTVGSSAKDFVMPLHYARRVQ